jgi:MarR family 2-MHQ and catechol resistance regulon transcriptional repressor
LNRINVLPETREAYYHERARHYVPIYPHLDLSSVDLVFGILFTYDQLHQIATRNMAAFGLSKSSFNILMLLRHAGPEGMQLHNLGEFLLVSRANITGLVDHLEEKGFAKRVVGPQDRRARYACITEKGEALLDEYLPLHYHNLNVLFQDVSPDERETLLRLLKKVRSSLSAHSAECSAGNRDLSNTPITMLESQG